MAVAVYTSKHLSPILISHELDPLKEGGHKKKNALQDENFSLRVAQSVHEVKAVYLVDDQPMEFTIRIPPEYPLQAVEIKELKRVGVSENIWRAWILAVQQVITSGVSRFAHFRRSVSSDAFSRRMPTSATHSSSSSETSLYISKASSLALSATRPSHWPTDAYRQRSVAHAKTSFIRAAFSGGSTRVMAAAARCVDLCSDRVTVDH